ncbi:hypothetical protein KFL_000920180 [Klebsormidium nitens]|uniref:Uncharacterized protein n=1 Tax=Klebsormidium nitens TaxID=105231 RepID=A0A0U9HLQ2_KLENI|nr:hypothetical protein KFL_000920180 [Klebsormidium nitens]|eukprot:GAQ81834.1 hypothetical protein KFL_000920180 [Klebsormidium nitens]
MVPARSVETGGTVSEKKEGVSPKLAALLVSGDLGCIQEALRDLDKLTKTFGGKKEHDYVLQDGETPNLLLDPNKSLKKANALLKHEEFSQALVQLLTNDAFLSQPQVLDRSDISTLILLFRRLCKIPDFGSKLLAAGLVDALAAFFQRFRLWAQLMTPRELLRPHAEDFLTQRLSWFRETLALVWGLLETSSAFAETAARSELILVLIRVWPPPGFEHSMYFTRRNINFDVAHVSELLMCTLEAAGQQRPSFAPLFHEKRNEVAEYFVRLMVWQRQRLAGSEDAHFPRWIDRTWGAFGALHVWRGARRKLVRKAHRLGTELLTAQTVPSKTKALVTRVLKELEAELSGASIPGRTEIDLSEGLPSVEHFLPRPTEVKKAAPRPRLSPAELASLFKSQEENAVLRGVKELAVIRQSCVALVKGFVMANPLANWEGYEDAGLRGGSRRAFGGDSG